jgi:hypothetical protein
MKKKLEMHSFAAIVAIIVLALPSPQAQSKTLMVVNCLGGPSAIRVPMDPAQRDRHDCCRKGCHAASERRKKGASDRAACC